MPFTSPTSEVSQVLGDNAVLSMYRYGDYLEQIISTASAKRIRSRPRATVKKP